MEMHQLKTFVTVAQEGHLTRASELLHLSQPAVSAHIKSLEDELGVSLFERTPKGMLLTPVGKLMLTQAKIALSATGDLLNQAKLLKDEISGIVKLGSIAEPLPHKMVEFLNMMASCYPQITLHMSNGISGTIVKNIKRQRLDVGYVLGTIDDDEIATIRLKTVRLYVTAPIAWRERIENAGWMEVASLPWVVTPPVCIIRNPTDNQSHIRKLQSADDPSQEITIENLLAAGFGLSILREEQALAAEQSGEVVLWRQLYCETPLSLLFLKGRSSDPVIKALVSVARQVWGNMDDSGQFAPITVERKNTG